MLQAAKNLLEEWTKLEIACTFDDVLLVPQYSDIVSRSTIDLTSNFTPLRKLQIPLIAANMDSVCGLDMALQMGLLGGCGVLHRYMSIEEQCMIIDELATHLKTPIAAAIGVKANAADNATKLVNAGCDVLVIDVAHGHHKHVVELITKLKGMALTSIHDSLPVEIIAGNIIDAISAKLLLSSGADTVKVGIGSGSICSTRTETGHGLPQLTATALCSLTKTLFDAPKTVISDGGMRSSGDIVKALAAGANCVMLGSMLAGTDKTPGELINQESGTYKIYRGMSSSEAQEQFFGHEPECPEGVSVVIPYKGTTERVVRKIVGGIKSGLSYSGCTNIEQLQENASWIRITPSGYLESLTLKDRK